MKVRTVFKRNKQVESNSNQRLKNEENEKIKENTKTPKKLRVRSKEKIFLFTSEKGNHQYDILHKAKQEEKQNVLSKIFYNTSTKQTPSTCRSLKVCKKTISVESKLNNRICKSHLGIQKKESLFSYSKDNIGNKEPTNNYEAVFYKDLCISGKDLSLWKRIKYHFSPLTSAKLVSNAYFHPDKLNETLSNHYDQDVNYIEDNLLIEKFSAMSNKVPYFKQYDTMYVKVEKTNTHQSLQNCYNCGDYNKRNLSKVIRSCSGCLKNKPCIYDKTKFTKLPVVHFSNNFINNQRMSSKASLKSKTIDLLQQILISIVDKFCTPCSETTCPERQSKNVIKENKKICTTQPNCVKNKTVCKENLIPHQVTQKNTCKHADKQNNINLQCKGLIPNENRELKVIKCGKNTKNVSGICIKNKCAKIMSKVHLKSSNVISNGTTKNVKKPRKAIRKPISKGVKTKCSSPENCKQRLIHTKLGDSYNKNSKPINENTISLKCRKKIKRNYSKNCLNCLKIASERNLCDDNNKQKKICECVKSPITTVRSPALPTYNKHQLNKKRTEISFDSNLILPYPNKNSKPIHENTISFKCGKKIKLNYSKDCLNCLKNPSQRNLCDDNNKQKKICECVKSPDTKVGSPALPTYNKHQLNKKRTEISFDSNSTLPYPTRKEAKLRRNEIITSRSKGCKTQTHVNQRFNASSNNIYELAKRKSVGSCQSQTNKSSCKGNNKKLSKNSQTQFKFCKCTKSDMDLKYKRSKGVGECCINSCCSPVRTDFECTRCTQQSVIFKHPAICTAGVQAGDCVRKYRCFSKTLPLKCPSLKYSCKSTNSTEDVLKFPSRNVKEKCSSKHQIFHNRSCNTISEKKTCQACLTYFPKNRCPSKYIQVSPRICTCTKNLRKAVCRKSRTAPVVKRKCKNKLQMYPSLPCHSTTKRSKYYALKCFFCKLKNDRNKQCNRTKCKRRKNTLQLDYDCRNLYEYTLRRRDCSMFSWMCPVGFPNCYSFCSMWRQCCEMMALTSMFCFWCPCLFLFEFCRICFCKCFFY